MAEHSNKPKKSLIIFAIYSRSIRPFIKTLFLRRLSDKNVFEKNTNSFIRVWKIHNFLHFFWEETKSFLISHAESNFSFITNYQQCRLHPPLNTASLPNHRLHFSKFSFANREELKCASKCREKSFRVSLKLFDRQFVICFHKNFSSIIKIQKVWKQIIKKKVSLSRKAALKQKFFTRNIFIYMHLN